jgi:glycosyltransferase involved in cell wall biosynthesis
MNEATGVLVPGGDAQAMAVSIERLLTDDSLRLRLGDNAALDAAKRFDLQPRVDEILNWYHSILENGVPAASRRARHAETW